MDNADRKPFDKGLAKRFDKQSKLRLAEVLSSFKGLGANLKVDWAFVQRENMHGSDVRIVSPDETMEVVCECEVRTSDSGRDHFAEIWRQAYKTVHVLLRKEDTDFDAYFGFNESLDRMYVIAATDVKASPRKAIATKTWVNGQRIQRDDWIYDVPNDVVACFLISDRDKSLYKHRIGKFWKPLGTLWRPVRSKWVPSQCFSIQ